MKTVILQRLNTGDQGTFGELTCDEFSCYTMELPWRQNKLQMSCIPQGDYKCQLFDSPRFGRYLYRLERVPNRNAILIHAANWGGDSLKGYRTQLNGCIALGFKVGTLEKQKALLESKAALEAFHKYMKGEPFMLMIREVTPVSLA